MSSTKSAPPADAARQKLIDDFWNAKLVPAAEALRKRAVRFFAPAADPAAPTYWHTHAPAADPFYVLEPDKIESLAREMWTKEGHSELAALAGPLMALAPQLAPDKADEGDVSPFIYVMF